MDNVFIGTIVAIVAFIFFLYRWFVEKESAHRKYTLLLSFSFLIIGLAAFIGTVFDMPVMGGIGLLGLIFMVYFIVKIELAEHRARKDISDEYYSYQKPRDTKPAWNVRSPHVLHVRKLFSINHNELETQVMYLLLKGDDPVLESLRTQYYNSALESREFTGAGFYTNYKLPPDTPPTASGKSFVIHDVVAIIMGDYPAAHFFLWVEKGKITTLEGTTFGPDEWSSDYSNLDLKYINDVRESFDDVRDLKLLRKKWA